ncbi:hypothetical protein B4090_3895 [Bacillus licheniformis]|nr:hypothetical protein B4090_3895 [Bacillus licheniformis]
MLPFFKESPNLYMLIAPYVLTILARPDLSAEPMRQWQTASLALKENDNRTIE